MIGFYTVVDAIGTADNALGCVLDELDTSGMSLHELYELFHLQHEIIFDLTNSDVDIDNEVLVERAEQLDKLVEDVKEKIDNVMPILRNMYNEVDTTKNHLHRAGIGLQSELDELNNK